MLDIYVNSWLNRRSGVDGRELPPKTVWRQFPAFLSTLAVEPRVLSRHIAKQRFHIGHLYWILTGSHLQCGICLHLPVIVSISSGLLSTAKPSQVRQRSTI
jgi:hypothetical protein